MNNSIDRKIFLVLLSLGALSVLCVFPYVLTVQAETLRSIGVPIGTLLAVQFIQSLVLFSIANYAGLYFTRKIGFHLPVLEAAAQKENYGEILRSIAGKSALLGVGTAVAIYATDALFTLLGAGLSTHQSYAPIWQKLLAAFYGGIAEEILMRLFLMTFFIWLSMKLAKRDQPSRAGIISSILLAAVIFGLGHLPITASLTAITPLIVLRAVVLNGIGGIVFGWLFWKKGLESAIIAHFTADIFLLTLLPLLFQ
jgi:membrane protease YdiL (CAAX protease family)